MRSNRNSVIDILRGIAIFTMTAANLSAALLQPDDKVLILRLYGTFAAPLFIMLAGMMVVITGAKHPSCWYFIKRGGLLVVFGCLLDVLVWHIYPFLSYDVLYLIGFSLPIVYLLAKYCSISFRIILVIGLVALTSVVQIRFNYRQDLVSMEIAALRFDDYVALLLSRSTLQRFLLDGWFPVMPWLSFAITGSILGSIASHAFASKRFLAMGIALFSVGVVVWRVVNPHLVIREGYSELFYPPTIGYWLTATGLIFIGYYCIDRTQRFAIYSLFLKLGHASLFMYLFHQVVLVYLLKPVDFMNNQALSTFIPTYLIVIIIMVVFGCGLDTLKQKYKNLPFIVRFMIGS